MAVGGAHPFAASNEPFRDVLGLGLAAWQQVIESQAGPLQPHQVERLMANDVDALRAAVGEDRVDVSPGLAELGLPWLAFVGGDDQRAEAAKAFATSTPGAHLAVVEGHNHMQLVVRAAPALPHVERFLDAVDARATAAAAR